MNKSKLFNLLIPKFFDPLKIFSLSHKIAIFPLPKETPQAKIVSLLSGSERKIEVPLE
jgi:hypothetical protein